MYRYIIVFIAAAGVLVTFQNCGKVSFHSAQGVLVTKTETEENHIIGEEPDPSINSEGPDLNSEAPPEENLPDDDVIVDEHPGKNPDQPEHPGPSEVQDNPEFICILEGPGKSNRLGISSDLLSENGQTPDTVCMSEHACREIVSQKFAVKGPERRGFCPNNNPHVIPLSDDEVQAKIDML